MGGALMPRGAVGGGGTGVGVAVGGTGVGVAVGGTGVGVGGSGVGVATGSSGVDVAAGASDTGVAAGAPHPTKSNISNVTPVTCCSNFWQLIFHPFRRGNQPPICLFCSTDYASPTGG